MGRTRLVHIFFFGILCISVFLFPKNVFAASVNLSSNQSQIGQNDTYTVNVSLNISATNGTTYYLRGMFYQSGTTNYCGYTYNGSAWYNGPYTTNNGWQNLLPITVQNSSWSGQLQAKLDTSDSGCSSSGTYNFKIQRFTQSGSIGSDSENEQTLSVVLPTPTSTPTPTTAATNTPQPTATPTQKPTSIVTARPTIKTGAVPMASSSGPFGSVSAQVLASSTSPTLVAGIEEKKKVFSWFAFFFIVGGVFLLASCGILFYYWKRGKLFHESNNE